jgi:hypothetical protein
MGGGPGRLLRLVAYVILVQGAGFSRTEGFSGRVLHAQTFSRRLADDLWFCLLPESDANGGGWRIAVQRACAAQGHNFVSVATPPFYGPNESEIAGWHFEPGAIAPQRVRDFAFVLNDEDWHRLMSDLNSYTDAEEMLHEIEKLGRGHGTLTIRDMHRHVKNGVPVFDWMQFHVVLQLPDN